MLCAATLIFCFATVLATTRLEFCSKTTRLEFCSKPSYLDIFTWGMSITCKQPEPDNPAVRPMSHHLFCDPKDCCGKCDNWDCHLCIIQNINDSVCVPRCKDGGQMICGVIRLELTAKGAVNFSVFPLDDDPSTWQVNVGQNNIVSVACYRRITPDSKM